MPNPRWQVICRRAILIAASLFVWFETQAMLGARRVPEGGIGDGLFGLTSGVNAFLQAHPALADRLLIASSLGIDASGIFLLLSGALGPSIRPFLAMLIIFALRQVPNVFIAGPRIRRMTCL